MSEVLERAVKALEDGFTLYPVRHALGAIVYSFTEESQRRWQEYADKQTAQLAQMMSHRTKDPA